MVPNMAPSPSDMQFNHEKSVNSEFRERCGQDDETHVGAETPRSDSDDSLNEPLPSRGKTERWSCRELCGDQQAISLLNKPVSRFLRALRWMGNMGPSISAKTSELWWQSDPQQKEKKDESSISGYHRAESKNSHIDKTSTTKTDSAASTVPPPIDISKAESFVMGSSCPTDGSRDPNICIPNHTSEAGTQSVQRERGSIQSAPVSSATASAFDRSVRAMSATAPEIMASSADQTSANSVIEPPSRPKVNLATVDKDSLKHATSTSTKSSAALIACWFECCHPRALVYFGTKEALQTILVLIKEGVATNDDPVLGDESKCVVWQGPLSNDGHPVLDIIKPNRSESRVFANRLICYLFASGDSFADIVDALPEDVPLYMACRNKRCVAVTHVSIDPLPSDGEDESDSFGSSSDSDESSHVAKP